MSPQPAALTRMSTRGWRARTSAAQRPRRAWDRRGRARRPRPRAWHRRPHAPARRRARLVDVRADHPGAATGELEHRCPADAGGSSRHQCRLSVEFHGLLPSCYLQYCFSAGSRQKTPRRAGASPRCVNRRRVMLQLVDIAAAPGSPAAAMQSLAGGKRRGGQLGNSAGDRRARARPARRAARPTARCQAPRRSRRRRPRRRGSGARPRPRRTAG